MTQRVIRKTLLLPLLAFMIGCGAGESTQVDRRFVAEMIPHHELGLQIIEIGQSRSNDVRLRRLIFEMGSYHHAELHALEALGRNWGLENAQKFPGAINQSQMDSLRILEGNAHDIAWLKIMIEHHEGALVISEVALLDTQESEIAQIARNVIATQSDELVKMRLLLSDLCLALSSKCEHRPE